MAYHSAAGHAFLSSASDQGIYRIDVPLKKTSTVSHWASIYGQSLSLGPVAVDTRRQRLLVSEAFAGMIYGLGFDSKKQSTVMGGLGVINSLSIDEPRDLLYIADSGKRTLWVAPLSTPVLRSSVFVRDNAFRGLSGVAAGSDGHVWVSIESDREVRVYDRAHNLIRKFR